jgi:hypothetical protein
MRGDGPPPCFDRSSAHASFACAVAVAPARIVRSTVFKNCGGETTKGAAAQRDASTKSLSGETAKRRDADDVASQQRARHDLPPAKRSDCSMRTPRSDGTAERSRRRRIVVCSGVSLLRASVRRRAVGSAAGDACERARFADDLVTEHCSAWRRSQGRHSAHASSALASLPHRRRKFGRETQHSTPAL